MLNANYLLRITRTTFNVISIKSYKSFLSSTIFENMSKTINTSRELGKYLATDGVESLLLNMRSLKDEDELKSVLDKASLKTLETKFIAMKSTKVLIKRATLLVEELSKRPQINFKTARISHKPTAPDIRIFYRPLVLIADKLVSLKVNFNSNRSPKLLLNALVKYINRFQVIQEIKLEFRTEYKDIYGFAGQIAAKAHKEFKLQIDKKIKNAAIHSAQTEAVPFRDLEDNEILAILKHIIQTKHIYLSLIGSYLSKAQFSRYLRPFFRKLYTVSNVQLIYSDYGFKLKESGWLREIEGFVRK